jgi:hypothetical protein
MGAERALAAEVFESPVNLVSPCGKPVIFVADREAAPSQKSPQYSLFPAENEPITLLSRRVPIRRLLTRSLHNLLHRQRVFGLSWLWRINRCSQS